MSAKHHTISDEEILIKCILLLTSKLNEEGLIEMLYYVSQIHHNPEFKKQQFVKENNNG